MGMIERKPYRVKRNGEWVWVYPEPIDYNEERKKNLRGAVQELVLNERKKKKK